MEQAIAGTTAQWTSSANRREQSSTPPVREVARPYLVSRIESGLAGRLVVLTAPAGWGKSSALAEWARETSVQVAWVECRRYAETGGRLVKGIVGALESVCPDFGRDLFAMLRSARPLPTPQLFAVLADALENYGEEVALVLDDFHVVRDEDALDAVFGLVTNGPRNLRVLIASRIAPPWPLARMRVAGDVVEIGPRELAFTTDEIRAFLDHGSTPNDVVDALHRRSGGWAAGVQLARLWMRTNPSGGDSAVVLEGSQRDIGDYMAEEVMSQLPPDLRRFLYATSLVDRFCLHLAEAMLGCENAGELLELAERQELFLTPDDPARRWYRYHDVFRDFLRSRAEKELGESHVDMLVQAASWLRGNGLVLDATTCLLKVGRVDDAAAILDDCARDLVLRDGDAAALITSIERMPLRVLGRYRDLQRFYGWALVLVGRLEEAERIAKELEAHLTPANAEEERLARSEAASIRARIAAYRGDHEATIVSGLEALECGDEMSDWFRADTLLSLGFAYRATGQLDEACEAFGRASELGWKSGFANAALWGSRYQALTLVSRGEMEDAAAQIDLDMERAREAGMSSGAAYAALLVGRGEIRYERNDLAGAREDLSAALRLAREAGDAKILMNVHVALAMLEAADGREREAFAAARTAVRVFDGTAEKAVEARLALRSGDMTRVRRWLESYREVGGDRPTLRLGEAEQLMVGRALMGMGQIERARDHLQALLRQAEETDRAGTGLTIKVLLATLEEMDGHHDVADRYASEVVDLAMRERYVRSVLDEGPRFLEILRRAIRHDGSIARREYARLLLTASGHPRPEESEEARAEAIDLLTPRQHEVLGLMMDGLSNREIANELYLAEGTVKAHMNQIFTKLMVRNRAEAIRAAQRLGLAG